MCYHLVQDQNSKSCNFASYVNAKLYHIKGGRVWGSSVGIATGYISGPGSSVGIATGYIRGPGSSVGRATAYISGSGSSVGIATRYGLDGPVIESR